jgi:hypothetical protein
MTAYYRRQVQVTKGVLNEVAYIRLYNPGIIDVVVRWEDWVKILPYITDGSFDTATYSCPTTMDQYDQLYQRILNVLNQLFTIEFPQSQ